MVVLVIARKGVNHRIETQGLYATKISKDLNHFITPFKEGFGIAARYTAGADNTIASLHFYLKTISPDEINDTWEVLETAA
jgi:hypothetical protein